MDSTVQNPVTELRKAAAAIRENARGTAGGPWKARPVWSPDSHVTSAVYSYAYPTGTVESEVVASGLKRYPKGGLRNPCNARWIAMMHPGLAEPLAAWLEKTAKDFGEQVIEDTVECPNCDAGTYVCGGHGKCLIHNDGCGGLIESGSSEDCQCFAQALAAARVILGGAE